MCLSKLTTLGLGPMHRHQGAGNYTMTHVQVWSHECQHVFPGSSRGFLAR